MGGHGLYSTVPRLRPVHPHVAERRRGAGRAGAEEGDRARWPRGTASASMKVKGLPGVIPSLSNYAEFFPGMPKSWALTFMINDEEAPTGRPAGALAWAGLANLYYWIDRQNGIGGFWARRSSRSPTPRRSAATWTSRRRSTTAGAGAGRPDPRGPGCGRGRIRPRVAACVSPVAGEQRHPFRTAPGPARGAAPADRQHGDSGRRPSPPPAQPRGAAAGPRRGRPGVPGAAFLSARPAPSGRRGRSGRDLRARRRCARRARKAASCWREPPELFNVYRNPAAGPARPRGPVRRPRRPGSRRRSRFARDRLGGLPRARPAPGRRHRRPPAAGSPRCSTAGRRPTPGRRVRTRTYGQVVDIT